LKLDLDKLLEGFGDDEPSGPDMEYEPEFSELTIAAQSKGEQQVGDQVKEAEDADYAEVIKLGSKLLKKTIDLRVAIYLAEASLNREGFPGFVQVLEYVRRALDVYWDSAHPQLDAEDDNDPTERVNALVGLVGDQGVLRQLRRAPLTDSKVMGRFTLRHIAVVKGEIGIPADMDETPDEAAINAAFQDTPEDKMDAIRSGIENSLEHATAIEAVLDEKVPGQSPDFEPLLTLLKSGLNAVRSGTGETVVEDGGEELTETAPAAATGGGGVSGVNSTADVKHAIDLILDYYKRNEPSSPVPIILTRAKRLVAADFMTIIKDIASSGEDEVRNIGGLPQDDY